MVKDLEIFPVAVDSNQYVIKVPVYVSEIQSGSDEIFGGVTYKHMVKSLIAKIDNYNSSSGEIKTLRRKKTFERVIKGINYYEVPIGTRTGLLIKMTSYNTNYMDGFYEEASKVALTKKSKIVSDNNFMLMFPNIFGNDPKNYKYQWVVLLYEDPNKDFNEISSTAKSVLKRIFDIKVENIKLKTVINSITIRKVAPEMIVRLVTVDHDTDGETPEFKEYLVGIKNKSITERQYKNLPADKVVELIKRRPFLDKRFQIIKRIKFGPKEYRVTQFTEGELTRKFKEQVEEIYNSEIEISEEELKNDLYNVNFVTEKLKKILGEYLASIDEK